MRTIFLHVYIVIYLITYPLIASPLANESIQKQVYDTTGYLNKNKSNNSIFIPMTILYENMLLPTGTDNIDTNFLKSYAYSLPKSSVPYILDIEVWKIGSNINDTVADFNIDKYIKVIKTMKEARPDLKFGYFGILPVRDAVRFGAPSTIDYNKWRHANIRAKRLSAYVDIICPDLYTFFNNENAWNTYAILAINESKMYNKPVLPFIWPEFHDSNSELKNTFIDSSLWEKEVSFLFKNADGIIIWGGRNLQMHTPRIWDDKAKWWCITKELILQERTKSQQKYIFETPVNNSKKFQKNKKDDEGYYKPINW
jgi:hypothetical protein